MEKYSEQIIRIREVAIYASRNRSNLIGREENPKDLLTNRLNDSVEKMHSEYSSIINLPPKLTSNNQNVVGNLTANASMKNDDGSQNIDELIRNCRQFLAELDRNSNNAEKYQNRDTNINNSENQNPNSDIIMNEIINLTSISLTLNQSDANTCKTSILSVWGKHATETSRDVCNGLVILIQVVVSQFRSLKHPETRIVSLILLVRLGIRCSDDIIVQRIIPICIHALEDTNSHVRATAIRCLRALLINIRLISSFESNIFTNYIFPSFSKLAKDSEVIVRVAFAESIGVIAEVSKRFLDRSHFMTQNKVINDTTPNVMNPSSTEITSSAYSNPVNDSNITNIKTVDEPSFQPSTELLSGDLNIKDIISDADTNSPNSESTVLGKV